jgi:hypothetical protein
MSAKQLDRLMFAQGGLCFFCKKPLAENDASVEHLVATVNGGPNHDHNCVACCKALNWLLGSMSLKEKIEVLLNQRGDFKCPNPNAPARLVAPDAATCAANSHASKSVSEKLDLIVADLRKRGPARPGNEKKLRRTIATRFQFSEAEVSSLIGKLRALGIIKLTGAKVSNNLPPEVAKPPAGPALTIAFH